MNPYLEPQGFLGTGASLLADITLVGYIIVLIPAMLLGWWWARKGKHRPHHKWLMVVVTIIIWILIVVLMVNAYRFDVIDNIARQPTNLRYLLPTLHGLVGIPAQLMATYVVIGMLREDSRVAAAKARGERNTSKYWFQGAKWKMRLVLYLWLITSALGAASYLVRYNVVQLAPAEGDVPPPVQTQEALAPESTPDDSTPEATSAAQPPAETPEATADVQPPAETPEVQAPAVTPEVDDSGQGRGRGRGRGGDEDEDDED